MRTVYGSEPNAGAQLKAVQVSGLGRVWLIVSLVMFIVLAAGVTISSNDPALMLADEYGELALSKVSRYFRIAAAMTLVWYSPLILRSLRRCLIPSGALLFFFVSSLWSLSSYETLSAALNLLLCIAMCIAATAVLGSARAVKFAWLAGVSLAAVSVILGISDSPYALTDGGVVWRGIFTTKNNLGSICGVLLIVLFVAKPIHQLNFIIRLLALLFCAYALIKSDSVGSILAVFASLGVLAVRFLLRQFGARRGNLYPLFFIVFGISVAAGIILFPAIVELFGRDLTFTGRTALWLAVFPLTLVSPFGYGYGTSGGTLVEAALFQALGVFYRAIDNAYIVLAMDVGWPFVLLYSFWLIKVAAKPLGVAARTVLGDNSVSGVAMFILVLGLVEKTGGPYLSFPFFTFILLYVSSERLTYIDRKTQRLPAN